MIGHRRIEIRPVGTNGDPRARAVLFDVDGVELCEIPATYVKPPDYPETARYVVLDLQPDTPPLWGAS